LKNKLGLSTSQDNLKYKSSIQHGNIYEDISRMIYESRHQIIVKEYGLIKTDKTPILGASPDGIVISSLNNNNSRIGRLVEIKNPYSYDVSSLIKPEYEIQIMQQQYVLDIPLCDFIKTNIMGSNPNNSYKDTGFQPYNNIDEFLADIPNETTKIQNININRNNLTVNGMEKGILIYYKNPDTNEYTIISYPLTIAYKKEEILEWLKKNKNEIKNKGVNEFKIGVDYWYLVSYFEKTVHYEEKLYEQIYIPRLILIWEIVNNLRVFLNLNGLEKLNTLIDNDLYNIFYRKNASGFYKNITNQNEILDILHLCTFKTPFYTTF